MVNEEAWIVFCFGFRRFSFTARFDKLGFMKLRLREMLVD